MKSLIEQIEVIKKPTVLLVEDDLTHLTIFETLLSQQGYDVLMAENVDQAIKILNCAAIDCIVSDVMLPGKNGSTLIDYLRETRNLAPIIMITSCSEEIERELLNKGANGFCFKQHATKRLVPQIRSLLGQF